MNLPPVHYLQEHRLILTDDAGRSQVESRTEERGHKKTLKTKPTNSRCELELVLASIKWKSLATLSILEANQLDHV